MPYLLDTHVLIWYAEGNDQLSNKARRIVDNFDEERFISMASVWEMGVKSSLGKLEFQPSFPAFVKKEFELIGYKLLQFEYAHIFQVEKLPYHHRDPFDRIIIAQAMAEGFPIVSADKKFDNYDIERIW